MAEFILIIPGKPISWSRPTFWKGRTLDPARQRVRRAEIVQLARGQMASDGFKKTLAHVTLEISFYGCHAGSDLSNLVKLVEDAFNDVVWNDDQQVANIHIYKRPRSNTKETVVKVVELDEKAW